MPYYTQATVRLSPQPSSTDRDGDIVEEPVSDSDFLSKLPAISVPLTGDSFHSFWEKL